MIKAVFFYLGGLLVDHQFSSMCKSIANMFNVNPKDMEKVVAKHLESAQKGKITDEEMWINICRDLKIPVPKKPWKEIYWEAWDYGYKEFPEVIEIAKRIKKKGYKIVVISNGENEGGYERKTKTKKIDKLINMFDYLVASYNHGVRAHEQNGKLFKYAPKIAKLKPEEVLIILGKPKPNKPHISKVIGLEKEGNYYKFKNSNLRAICYENVPKLVSDLKEIKVLIT